jgi:Fe2+ transport system protein B
LLAKENVISVFGVLAGCIAALGANIDGVVVSDALLQAAEGADSVAAMVSATGITVPALLAYIVFNMTTIPCFAAVATAKAEHPASRKFGWTIAFWLGASYIAGIVIYTIGSWWWTLFIWLVVAAVVVTLIVLNNKGKISFKKIFNRQKD